MHDDKAQLLVDKNLNRINKLDSSFYLLTEQMNIELEESKTGETNLNKAHMNLGTQHQHISKSTGVSEDVLLSYIFYHEMGHQILPWSRTPTEQRASLMTDYFSQNIDFRGSPEYFLIPHNISLFHSPDLQSFSDKLCQGFDHSSEETNGLLNKFAQKMEGIYHEQFAECFALFMVKKQFPKEFDKFTDLVIEKRKNGELFYRDIHDDLMENNGTGFVHCLHNVTNAYLAHSKTVPLTSFTAFEKEIFPLIDKYTVIEMKNAMDYQKLAVYFPKELKVYLSEVATVESKIKSIRDTFSNIDSLSIKNKK